MFSCSHKNNRESEFVEKFFCKKNPIELLDFSPNHLNEEIQNINSLIKLFHQSLETYNKDFSSYKGSIPSNNSNKITLEKLNEFETWELEILAKNLEKEKKLINNQLQTLNWTYKEKLKTKILPRKKSLILLKGKLDPASGFINSLYLSYNEFEQQLSNHSSISTLSEQWHKIDHSFRGYVGLELHQWNKLVEDYTRLNELVPKKLEGTKTIFPLLGGKCFQKEASFQEISVDELTKEEALLPLFEKLLINSRKLKDKVASIDKTYLDYSLECLNIPENKKLLIAQRTPLNFKLSELKKSIHDLKTIIETKPKDTEENNYIENDYPNCLSQIIEKINQEKMYLRTLILKN